jgi:hypothetical protein
VAGYFRGGVALLVLRSVALGPQNKQPRDGNAGLEVAGVPDARQVYAIHAQHRAPVGRDCKTMFRQSSLPDPAMRAQQVRAAPAE